jgi:hypothetical protein
MRAIILLIWLLPSGAFAEARIALLIGNQAYDASVGVLKNSHNDIAVVGEALRAQNFDVLPPIKDASRSAILGGVRELVRRLNEAGAGSIGFLYYSGHGAAEKGTNINYLIPRGENRAREPSEVTSASVEPKSLATQRPTRRCSNLLPRGRVCGFGAVEGHVVSRDGLQRPSPHTTTIPTGPTTAKLQAPRIFTWNRRHLCRLLLLRCSAVR